MGEDIHRLEQPESSRCLGRAVGFFSLDCATNTLQISLTSASCFEFC